MAEQGRRSLVMRSSRHSRTAPNVGTPRDWTRALRDKTQPHWPVSEGKRIDAVLGGVLLRVPGQHLAFGFEPILLVQTVGVSTFRV